MQTRSIAKNSIYNVIYNVINVLLPLVTSIYVSRILMPAGVGKVAYANTIVSYFVTFSALGLPTYGIRAISQARDCIEEKNRVFTELFIINAIATSIAIVAYLSLTIFNVINGIEKQLYLICGIQLLFCYFNVDWLYRGEEDYKYITIRSVLIKVLSLLALVLFVKDEQDYLLYALIHSLAISLNHILNIINARHYIKLSLKKLDLKRHLKPVCFLAVSVLFATVYSMIDITMLGVMKTDSTVGIYSNAHKIINIVITACISITSVFLPRISYLYKNCKEDFNKLVEQGIDIIGFIVIPASIGLYLLADNAIILLFGDSFAGSAIVLKIFTPLLIIKGFGDLLCHQVVVSIGQEKYLVPVAGCAMVINIILNTILIKTMAESGAAIASVISELFLNTVLLVFVKKFITFEFPIRNMIKDLFASIIMAVIVGLIISFDISTLARCLLGGFVGCMVYYISGLIMRNTIAISLTTRIRSIVINRIGK